MSTTPSVPYRLEVQRRGSGHAGAGRATIATAKGMSAWFLPTEMEERRGRPCTFSMGPEMGSDGQVSGWDPPRRIVYEEDWARPDGQGPGCAQPADVGVPRRGGSPAAPAWCAITSSGLPGTGAAWESEFWDDMGRELDAVLRQLRLYLSRFPGQEDDALEVTASPPGDAEALWSTLHDALGLGDEGATVEVRGVPARSGVSASGRRWSGLTALRREPRCSSSRQQGRDGGATAGQGLSPVLRRRGGGARAARGAGWQAWLQGLSLPA